MTTSVNQDSLDSKRQKSNDLRLKRLLQGSHYFKKVLVGLTDNGTKHSKTTVTRSLGLIYTHY